jgi:hypothetical protein
MLPRRWCPVFGKPPVYQQSCKSDFAQGQNMKSREHASRHLLALPSWKQEQLEREFNDPHFDAGHDHTMRWRARQMANHAIELEGKV